MTQETSAGVLIYTERPRRYLLLMKHKSLDFPKGKLEKDETPEQAAIRETKEETGLTVQLQKGFKRQIRYTFQRGKTKIRKSVTFYLAKSTVNNVKISKEHSGYLWLTPEEARKQVRHRNHKNLLAAAETFLNKK